MADKHASFIQSVYWITALGWTKTLRQRCVSVTVSWVKPEKQIIQKPGQSIVTTGTVHLIRSKKRRLLIIDVLLKKAGGNGHKTFWRTLKKDLTWRKKGSIHIQGIWNSEMGQIANSFNKFFTGVATRVLECIPSCCGGMLAKPSISRPLLFILLFNDLPDAVVDCSLLMNGDDTMLFFSAEQASLIE